MRLPPNDSPLWTLAIIIAGFAGGTIACTTLYKNGFAVQDILTIASIIGSMIGVKGIQALSRKSE